MNTYLINRKVENIYIVSFEDCFMRVVEVLKFDFESKSYKLISLKIKKIKGGEKDE